MRKGTRGAVLAVIVVLASVACIPQRFVGFSSPTYSQEQNWLCRPGSAAPNACVGSFLDSTIVHADGSTTPDPFHGYDQSAPTAPIDCFYVYPTVASSGDDLNDLAMAADPAAEIQIVQEQAARFTSVCNVFAPLYRQMKFSTYFAPSDQYHAANDLAYGDVHEAFKHYMATYNGGRPIVLIGHSQGAQHLLRLLQDEFDDDPQFTKSLVAADIVGWPVMTAAPGTPLAIYALQHIPMCHNASQTSCVVTYQSFGAANPPPTGGSPAKICVNPTSVAGGTGPIKAFVSPDGISGLPPVSTATVELPGSMTAQCVVPATGAPYLSIAATHQPGDVRDVDAILMGPSPSFGLHLREVDLTQGNLLDLVRSQAAARGITIP